jgi:hypothetical protein
MTRAQLLRSGAVCAFLLALVVLWFADLTKQLICYGDAATTCRMGLMNAQLVTAIAGLLSAGGLVWAVWSKRRRVAVAMLVVGVAVYAGWAVLNDAAVHGW